MLFEGRNLKDRVGQIINGVLVLALDEEKTHNSKFSYWFYHCPKCNKLKSARSDKIGTLCLSCRGKIARKQATNPTMTNDLTNKQFGQWLVLNKTDKTNYWHCKCLHCGNERDVFRGNLTSHLSRSCGCINSWGETQFSFEDLKMQKKLRFDFAIFKKNQLHCLLEYDGRQHFNYDSNWNISEEQFEQIQKSDLLKNQYCFEHHIKLIRLNENSNLEQCIKTLYEEINNEI